MSWGTNKNKKLREKKEENLSYDTHTNKRKTISIQSIKNWNLTKSYMDINFHNNHNCRIKNCLVNLWSIEEFT